MLAALLVIQPIVLPRLPFFQPSPFAAWVFVSWLIISVIGAYRLVLAYSLSLRFDRPLATIVASQVIVFLINFILVLPIVVR